MVKEGKPFSACDFSSGVSGTCLSAILLANDSYGIARSNLSSIVCGSIVDDNDFEQSMRLSDSAFNRATDEFSGVVGGYYGAHQGKGSRLPIDLGWYFLVGCVLHQSFC